MSYVIGLDVGTTGVRAILWDKDANKVGESYEIITVHSDPSGKATSDPIAIFNSTVRVLKSTLQYAKKGSVASIGLATQRCSMTIWDKRTGIPVIPLILWKDTRTGEEAQQANTAILPKIVRGVSGIIHFFTRSPKFLTGRHFQISTHNIGLKVKHILSRNPEIKQGIEKGDYLFGTLDTWLVWKLTAGALHVTEWSNFSATALWDPYAMDWSGIMSWIISPWPGEYWPSTAIYPTVKDTCDDYGICDPEILGATIPISAVVGDQQAALFGHGCFSKGDTKVTLGTGGFLVQNTGDTCLASSHYIYPLIAWKIGSEITYMLEGTINSVGSVMDWMLDNHLASSYEELNNIKSGVEGENDVYFVPAFSGLSTPYHNSGARGTFMGLTHTTSKTDLVRSVLESGSFRTQQIIEALLEDSKIPIREIRVDGGVSRNDFVVQSIANITGIKTLRPMYTEMTSLGAAFLAGLKVGFWKDKAELKGLVKIDKMFEGHVPLGVRNARVAQFNSACERAKDWVVVEGPHGGGRKWGWLGVVTLLLVGYCLVYGVCWW